MAGRKPKYTPERVERICKAISEGQSEKNACIVGGIHRDTFATWMREHSDFSDRIKKAKQDYQDWLDKHLLEDAERGLMRLVCGEEYVETTTEYETINGELVVKKKKEVNKRILPNTTAIIFALTNRAPEKWKNRLSQDVNGKIQTESKSDVSLANVPDDLLEKVIESIRK